LLCLTKLNAEESFRRKKKKRNKEGRNERKREKEKKEKSLRQNKKTIRCVSTYTTWTPSPLKNTHRPWKAIFFLFVSFSLHTFRARECKIWLISRNILIK
jgi:hypothetical protein